MRVRRVLEVVLAFLSPVPNPERRAGMAAERSPNTQKLPSGKYRRPAGIVPTSSAERLKARAESVKGKLLFKVLGVLGHSCGTEPDALFQQRWNSLLSADDQLGAIAVYVGRKVNGCSGSRA